MLLYLAWRLLQTPAYVLPLPQAYAVGRALMQMAYWGLPAARAVLRANLQPVLGTSDRHTLDHWSGRQLRRFGEYGVDALRLHRLTPQNCLAALETDPDVWPRLRALYGNEPILFALLHFGNWDVGGGAFTAACGRSHVLVDSLGHPALDHTIRAAREGLGMTPIPIEAGARPLLRALRKRGAAAILFDRPVAPAEPGVDVTFFGRPCRLPAGMARLALATHARVVPLAIARLPDRNFRFRALIDLDFTYPRSGDRAADIRALTQGVLDVYEPWVRRYPDQWYQLRPFFRLDGNVSP